MVAKVALAALISAGLLVVSVATAHAVLHEASAKRPVAAAGSDSSLVARLECAGAATSAVTGGHHAWNTASWLIGLSLVLAISRRSPQPVS